MIWLAPIEVGYHRRCPQCDADLHRVTSAVASNAFTLLIVRCRCGYHHESQRGGR